MANSGVMRVRSFGLNDKKKQALTVEIMMKVTRIHLCKWTGIMNTAKHCRLVIISFLTTA